MQIWYLHVDGWRVGSFETRFASAMACSARSNGNLCSLPRLHYCTNATSLSSAPLCRAQCALLRRSNRRDHRCGHNLMRNTIKLYASHLHEFLAVAPICFNQVSIQAAIDKGIKGTAFYVVMIQNSRWLMYAEGIIACRLDWNVSIAFIHKDLDWDFVAPSGMPGWGRPIVFDYNSHTCGHKHILNCALVESISKDSSWWRSVFWPHNWECIWGPARKQAWAWQAGLEKQQAFFVTAG